MSAFRPLSSQAINSTTRHGGFSLTSCSWRARPSARLLLSPRAINNQHSHIEEELVRMQTQLRVAAPPKDAAGRGKAPSGQQHQPHHHIIHDTDHHPYQRQPHRLVHHEHHHDGAHGPVHGQPQPQHHHQHTTRRDQGPVEAAHSLHAQQSLEHADQQQLADAVELSHQYSSNIVTAPNTLAGAYTPAPAAVPARPQLLRARVPDYAHPSSLCRDLVAVLQAGDKLLLELPDEPAAVSSLLTALGTAAAKLQAAGLATALDPVYDPAAPPTACSAGRHAHSHSAAHGAHHVAAGHAPSHTADGSRHDASAVGHAGHSTHASHDHRHRHAECCFQLCARAVPMPHAPASPAGGAGGSPGSPYTVGSSLGQAVLRVSPSSAPHALLPALLDAILKDGLVTLRCAWFDEEITCDQDWLDDNWDHSADGADATRGSFDEATGSGFAHAPQQQHHYQQQQQQQQRSTAPADLLALAAAAAAGAAAPASAHFHPPPPPPPPPPPLAGSLVRVPGVLRAIFKLDRQLRGLELGGLVLLPHSFLRTPRHCNTPVLYLDVVIA